MGMLLPDATISTQRKRSGFRWLIYDAIFSQSMAVITTGTFLVAFALQLGASNKVIGALAAIAPATQILQLPAIWIVQRFRKRKLLTIGSVVISRCSWLVIATIPWLMPSGVQLPVLILCLLVFYAFGSFAGCPFNSWMRDLVPQNLMGRYFATRSRWAIGIGAVLTILAGFAVDLLTRLVGQDQIVTVLSGLFALGFVLGILGAMSLSRVPEPRMADSPHQPFLRQITEPFREKNFRALLTFLAIWNFAINLPGPFVAVYLLQRLELPLSLVVAFGVLSQFSHVLSLKAWGRLSDRLSNKNVLQASASLFALCWLLIPLTTMPDKWVMTLPFLTLFFILTGVATAGIGLCSGNIAMKLAPDGRATSFLAVNTLVSGAAATMSPLLSGVIADSLSNVHVDFNVQAWLQNDSDFVLHLPALSLVGLDFLFVIGFLVCFYAIHRLLAVREEGEVGHEIAYQQILLEVRRTGQAISNIPGMRVMTTFPFALLLKVRKPDGFRSSKPRDPDEPFD